MKVSPRYTSYSSPLSIEKKIEEKKAELKRTVGNISFLDDTIETAREGTLFRDKEGENSVVMTLSRASRTRDNLRIGF